MTTEKDGSVELFAHFGGYAKKALNYTIQADKLNEFVSQLENFIERVKEELFYNKENIDSIVRDLIQIKYKERQHNRDITNINDQYSESVIQDFSNQKRVRHYQKYKKTGHYAS
ncbi:hypothetical protein C1646_822213 [Rhizophagus diaphanus]|nr:hypothetical protein C1646_822213 [Rhizophagus diaphanus] [Rhizophagus sp. MUCL 43196]